MKYRLVFILLFFLVNLHGQSSLGVGLDIGIRSFGPRIELSTLNHFRFDTGFQITRFTTVSNHLGFKLAMMKMESRHNVWLGTYYKYKYRGPVIHEVDNTVLEYKTNALNYCSARLGYNFRKDVNVKSKRALFDVFELTLQYDFLIGKSLDLIPDQKNKIVSDSFERSMQKYFNGGLGVYASVVFFFELKRRNN